METAVALDLSPCIEISIASRCYRTLVDLPITVSHPAAYLLIQYVAEIIPVYSETACTYCTLDEALTWGPHALEFTLDMI